jgi:tetratricopeptide (TPR) repeat protein
MVDRQPISWTSLALALVLGLLAPACQSTMSVEEVRQAYAAMTHIPLAPPPRTITDIKDLTGLIDTGQQSDALRIADSSIPETGDPDDLGARYHLRGKAARRIGRFAQAVADFTRAAEYVKPGSRVRVIGTGPWSSADAGLSIQRDLAETLATSGSFWQALAQYERAILYSRRTGPGYQLELLGGLVQLYAAVGDLKAAERTLGELRLLRSESHRWGYPALTSGFAWEASVLRAEGAVLDIRGRFTEAERRWRRSIAMLEGFPYSSWLEDRLDGDALRLAHCLLRQGRLLEAETEVRRVLYARPRRSDLIGHDSVAAVTLLAKVLRAQGRYSERRHCSPEWP